MNTDTYMTDTRHSIMHVSHPSNTMCKSPSYIWHPSSILLHILLVLFQLSIWQPLPEIHVAVEMYGCPSARLPQGSLLPLVLVLPVHYLPCAFPVSKYSVSRCDILYSDPSAVSLSIYSRIGQINESFSNKTQTNLLLEPKKYTSSTKTTHSVTKHKSNTIESSHNVCYICHSSSISPSHH